MQQSRTSKSLKNSVISLTYYFVNLIVQFYSRKVFLEYLGTEILGLNTTATNLLQFLNLAELGISTAVGFSLYKPIHSDDYNSISEIITLQGHIYKRVAYLIIIGAGILMCFFPQIFSKMKLPLWYSYATFGVLLYSALLGYFFNYKQIVLTASQQNYKVLYSFKTVQIAKYIAQAIVISNVSNGYIAWLVLEAIFSTIGAFCLHKVTIRSFPYLKNTKQRFRDLRNKYTTLTKKIGQLFFHKIGAFALTQTSPIIIYSFANLTLVAYYGNYLLVTQGVNMMVRSAFDSVSAGIGSLVVEGNINKIINLFKELFSFRFLLVTIVCFAVLELTPWFIRLWIGDKYLLSDTTLVLMVIMLYIQLFRPTVESFINAYGLFGDILAPIVEATLNIGLSILGGYLYGLNGILAGSIISLIVVVVVWKPYYLFHKEIRGFGLKYILMYVKHIAIVSIVFVLTKVGISQIIPADNSTWIGFFIYSVIYVSVFSVLMIAGLMMFRTPLRSFALRFKK